MKNSASFFFKRSCAAIRSHPRLTRWILCGPVAFAVTFLTMMGMALWWPVGAARVNNIIMPIVLFPLIWAAAVFYALLDDNLPRAVGVMIVLVLGHWILLQLG